MIDDNAPPRRWASIPAWVALGLSLCTIFWQAAIMTARVSENTRRIELVEAAQRQNTDTVSRIDARTARIEATLDFVIGRKPNWPQQHSIDPPETLSAP